MASCCRPCLPALLEAVAIDFFNTPTLQVAALQAIGMLSATMPDHAASLASRLFAALPSPLDVLLAASASDDAISTASTQLLFNGMQLLFSMFTMCACIPFPCFKGLSALASTIGSHDRSALNDHKIFNHFTVKMHGYACRNSGLCETALRCHASGDAGDTSAYAA